jgi:hypothetical protein
MNNAEVFEEIQRATACLGEHIYFRHLQFDTPERSILPRDCERCIELQARISAANKPLNDAATEAMKADWAAGLIKPGSAAYKRLKEHGDLD